MLQTLYIQSLRNLVETELEFSPINVFFGDNGSGKTSILEAIYLLSTGRSFRAVHTHVIQHGAPALYLRGLVVSPEGAEIKVALQKSRNNAHIIKCSGQEVPSIAEIAKHLPVQALHLLNYQLLQASPDARRKQLDWGVFHVKHSFLEQWRTFNQLLKQRNAAIRQQQTHWMGWDELLAQAGEAVHQLRQQVCEGWFPYAQRMIADLLSFTDITLEYAPGWDTYTGLFDVFNQNIPRDLALGYTYNGPQRADLVIKTQGRIAQHVLSQGQQKSVVAALQLSQSAWVYEQTAAQGVLLIDDLPAELDLRAQQQIMRLLSQLNLQVFFTCVEKSTAKHFAETLNARLFHVEHGVVRGV